MKAYDFIDIGCKDGGSFPIARQFGYTKGIGIDIEKKFVDQALSNGIEAIVADALNIPFPDKHFKMAICSHVIEHLADEDAARKAISEMIRVSSEKIMIAFPVFDHDEYLRSLGLKTFYSHWTGHTNLMKLETLLEMFKGYKYVLKMIKLLEDSSAVEIHPIESPIDCLDYDQNIHPPKRFVKFDRPIHREFQLFVDLKKS